MTHTKNALTSEAYHTIKKQIIDLHLRPGELILVQQLAKKLDISRTPVREALVRLKQEGLVQSAEGRKFKVAEFTLDTVMEIYEIRSALESLAVAGVTSTIKPGQIQKLSDILQTMKAALEKNDDDLFFDSDLYFHNYIIELYGNKTIEAMLKQLNDKLQRVRYLTKYIDGRVENTIDEHTRILEHIRKKDAEAAKNAYKDHLNKVKTGIEELFKDSSKRFLIKPFIKN